MTFEQRFERGQEGISQIERKTDTKVLNGDLQKKKKPLNGE